MEGNRGEVLGGLLGKLLDEGLKGGLGRCVADAGLEADADVEPAVEVLGNLLRDVDIGVVPGETRRRDTDDGVVLVDHLQGLAHDGAVAVEVPLPELVAEDDDRLGVLAIDGVRGLQAAAQRRGDAEVLEGVGAEVVGCDIFRQVGAGDCQVPLVGGECIVDDRRFANLLPLAGGESDAIRFALAGVDAQMDHAVGAEVGVGIDQEAINHAENGGGGPMPSASERPRSA